MEQQREERWAKGDKWLSEAHGSPEARGAGQTHIQGRYNLCTGALGRFYQVCPLLYRSKLKIEELERGTDDYKNLLYVILESVPLIEDDADIYDDYDCDELFGTDTGGWF